MAAIACVLWVAGFEVLPWLHVALHDHAGKHHHDASGAIVHDDDDDDHDDDDHDHDDHDDDDHDDHDHDPVISTAQHHDHRPPGDRERRIRDALTHGRHSLAHHDVAITSPPPVTTQPLPCDRRPSFVLAVIAIEPFSFSPGRAVARGPPAAAFGI